MSWYRDNDGKIITDEEFQSDCTECSCFCQEGTISIPCNGERTDCPYFKEVDASEYDKEIRNKAIDEFAERMSLEISESIIGGMLFDNRDNSSYDTADKIVDYVIDTAKKIAEQLKGGAK